MPGQLEARSAKAGTGIKRNGARLDIGVPEVLVPDTPWSRDPRIVRPLLPGLGGFFGRLRMRIDHSKNEFRIRVPGKGVVPPARALAPSGRPA